jgi:hypothetical protein
MPTQLERTLHATLLVMVNVMKGGGRAPPPSPAWANFTLMMECTPESRRCYSVYSVVLTVVLYNPNLENRLASVLLLSEAKYVYIS